MGDIIIIQNSEHLHIKDIFEYVINNLNEQDYINFTCPYIKNNALEINENINIITNNILNYDNTNYCGAIFKSKLKLIGDINNVYEHYFYDELMLKLKYNLKLNTKEIKNTYIINNCKYMKNDIQNEEYKYKYLNNKKIYENNIFNYPKLLHLYWDCSKMSFMNFVTILSFKEYHKNWIIIIHMPLIKHNIITWISDEQKYKYNNKCYLNELKNINNIVFNYINFNNIGFSNDISEVIKSDYLRYYMLSKHGGIWSDFDIIYTYSIEKKINFSENTCIFKCTDADNIYYPIGFFACNPNSKFFNFILKNINNFYNENEYQCIGGSMFKKILHDKNINEIDESIKILNEDYYLPYAWNKIYILLNNKEIILPENNFGIHLFNGLEIIKKHMEILENKFTENIKPTCFFDLILYKYYNLYFNNINTTIDLNFNINKIQNITLIVNYVNQREKLMLMLENFNMIYKHKYTITYNIITKNNLCDTLINYCNYYSLKYNTYLNIDDAVKNSDNYIIFQDLIITHKTDLITMSLNYMSKYEFIGINKIIENKQISDELKEQILTNKLFDICIFNKKTIINNIDFKFNMKYIQNNINYININRSEIEYLFPNKIPKKIHFYWDGSKGCYLTNLAFKTFIFNNPEWEINLWMPKILYKNIIKWEKQEFVPPHFIDYNDYDYINYEYLKNNGVNIHNIDYYELGLKFNINEVLKSDIFRWKILYEIGGVWSDLDILFVDKIEKTNFEKFNCFFHNIEFVVSQYERYIEKTKIDFYYIGFLMSSKNCSFYKIMYEEALKNINETSYQGVGGDLMKKHFGLYDDIKKIVGHDNYCNLESSSVYYYWWADLKNMYLNNMQGDINDFLLHNNNIIGYHWFRGVHLSKIYSLFLNYKNKIQNFDFNGPLPLYVSYYKEIFNDFTLNKTQKKISIVMGYINRLKQLEITIQTIMQSKHINYEIIIVNDGEENIDFLIEKYNVDMKIINNYLNKSVNPCMSYNLGIKNATGEIIIIQNPECCHIGDVLTVTNVTLKQNDHLTFSAFYLDNYEKNNKLYDILLENKNNNFWSLCKIKKLLNFTLDYKQNNLPKNTNGWVSHHFYNKNHLHFCIAMYKSDLLKINCFSDEYQNGICFDDDDLVRKTICNNFNRQYFCIAPYPESYPSLAEFSTFVIHQHHDHFSYGDENIMKGWNINKNIFIDTHINYINKYILSLYSKNILMNCNVNLDNLQIESYENSTYEFLITNNKNSLTYKPNIYEEIFEYIFNGKTMKLSNNIIELLNDSIYELKINANIEELQIELFNNIITLNQTNENYFKYIGKIDIKNIKFLNLLCNQKLKIKCELHLLELTNKNNTILTEGLF